MYTVQCGEKFWPGQQSMYTRIHTGQRLNCTSVVFSIDTSNRWAILLTLIYGALYAHHRASLTPHVVNFTTENNQVPPPPPTPTHALKVNWTSFKWRGELTIKNSIQSIKRGYSQPQKDHLVKITELSIFKLPPSYTNNEKMAHI